MIASCFRKAIRARRNGMFDSTKRTSCRRDCGLRRMLRVHLDKGKRQIPRAGHFQTFPCQTNLFCCSAHVRKPAKMSALSGP